MKEFFRNYWQIILLAIIFLGIGVVSGYLYRRSGDIEIFRNYALALKNAKEDFGQATRDNAYLQKKIIARSDSLSLIRDANPYAWWEGLISELAADTAVTAITINFLNESPQEISFDGVDEEDRRGVALDYGRDEPIASVEVFYGKQASVYTLADVSGAWLASLAK